jgi:hypothetical protein
MNRWSGLRLALAIALAATGVALNGSPASAISIFPHIRMPQPSSFDTEVELQGMYDEMSGVYPPALTDGDVDLFYSVVYTPDWVFVDTAGRRLTRTEWSARETQASDQDSLIQRIEAVSPAAGGVKVYVTATSVHAFVDTAGRYGRPGASHTLTAVTQYRDVWVRNPDGWKMKWREQAGPTRTVLDKPEWGM